MKCRSKMYFKLKITCYYVEPVKNVAFVVHFYLAVISRYIL